ncbi:MAG: Npt1/Npt2 family nucleotide transporter [bacterium]
MSKISKTGEKILHGSVEIREGEVKKTLLMALFFFLVIFAITVVKPVRNSLFLSKFGISKLPYMYIGTAIFTGVLVLLDSKLSDFLNRAVFMSITIGFLLVNLLLFWWLVKVPDGWIPAAFYIWINFFNYVLVAHFWAFANEFFNPREGKRLFGFILTVGTLGGIAGGLTADLSVRRFFETEDVLLIAAFTLLLCIGVVQLIESVTSNPPSSKEMMSSQDSRAGATANPLDRRFYRRHLSYLGVMVVLVVIVSTLIDYQFNFMVASTYPTKMAKTEFYGRFFAILNMVSLFVQFFLTSKILKRFGIGTTLLLMPLILSFGSVGLFFFPTIMLAAFLKITDKTLHYSLVQTSRELLFLPIASQIRVKAKLVINIFVNRLAGAVAACLILFIPLTVLQLSGIVLVFLLIWIGIIGTLKTEYIRSIKRLLVRRDVDVESSVIATLDGDMIATLIRGLNSKDNQKVRYALSLLELVPGREMVAQLMPLLDHWDARIRAQSLRLLFKCGDGKNLEPVMPLLSDPDIEVRSEAIHFIWAYCEECPTERITEFLTDSEPKIKGAMLASMINHTGRLTPEAKEILNQMVQNHSPVGEAQRVEAARVLGILDQGLGLHDKLSQLLMDSSVAVQRAAIESAGRAVRNEFILLLVAKLGNPKLRGCARDALAQYGNRVVPLLRKILIDSDENLRIRRSIPRVLFRIQTKESWETLQENVAIHNAAFRYEIIKSLNKVRQAQQDWRFDFEKIHHVLLEEIESHYWKLNIFYAIARKETLLIDVREVDDILSPALKENLERGLERIFRLLALLYSPDDVYNAYYYLTQGSPTERAHALELLDNLLPNDLEVQLLPILDEVSLGHKIRQGRALFNLSKLSRKEAMSALLYDDDLWLRVCTIYNMGREGVTDYQNRIKPHLKSNEPILKEAAERFFQILHHADVKRVAGE